MDEAGAFESALQRAWDRELSRKPVLLLLIGSDLSMMEVLTSYGRPFHQRGTDMTIGPLNVGDVAARTGLGAAEAFYVELVTGGLPIVFSVDGGHGSGFLVVLGARVADPVTSFVASAQLSLAAEFPDQAQARAVLGAIGSGERTFTEHSCGLGIPQ